MTAAIAFGLRHWKLLLGAFGMLVLGIMLANARSDARDWKRKAEAQAKLYAEEQVAHLQTVANVRAATEQARRADAENKARALAEQNAITERTVDEYEARIAAVRDRYAGLVRDQGTPPTNPGSGRGPAVPGAGAAPGRADGAAAQGRLPLPDALIATEQAIQLDALQAWVRGQARVEN